MAPCGDPHALGAITVWSALMAQLFLASGSPRRHELLGQIGVPFTPLQAPQIDETPMPGEEEDAYVQRLVWEKAPAGWYCMADTANACVLGAVSIVRDEGQLLGNLADAEEAAAMLAL